MQEKMSANKAIVDMVRYINVDDKEKFYDLCEKYLATLSPTGDYHGQLKRALGQRPLKMMKLTELTSTIEKLVRPSYEGPKHPVFLPKIIEALIEELLHEWKHIDVLKAHNLGIRNKILLNGPSGNGKTTMAKHIADLANLPFVEVNSEAMINSHMGASAKNIEQLLGSISQPCVLFWDEVDSVAKQRGNGSGSAAEHENDRTVNSLLINLDKLDEKVIFVCATNRADILDPAFLRRMDETIEVAEPTIEEKRVFWLRMCSHYNLPLDIGYWSMSDFKNFAEIKQSVEKFTRKYVLEQINKSV